MANEGTIKTFFKFVKNGVSVLVELATLQFDVAGTNVLDHVQSIGTSEEAITLGDITVGGYARFENLDSTNFIELRQATGASDFCRLLAGDVAIFRISPDMTAPFAIADTASCDMRVTIIDL